MHVLLGPTIISCQIIIRLYSVGPRSKAGLSVNTRKFVEEKLIIRHLILSNRKWEVKEEKQLSVVKEEKQLSVGR